MHSPHGGPCTRSIRLSVACHPHPVGLPQCRQANAAPTVKMVIRSFVRPNLQADGAQTTLPIDNSAADTTAATVVDGHVVAPTTLPSTRLLRTAGVLRVPWYLGHP